MPTDDPRVQAAIAHWGPRFVAQGVDPNDFERTTERMRSWDDWLPGWEATGTVHEDIGNEAEGAGHNRTAGEAYVVAALCYHFGKFLWFVDEDRHWEMTYKARDVLRRAHAMLDPGAERVEVSTPHGSFVGNLRVPAGSSAPPLALLLPGLDSAKEEFFHWECVFLDRGMATLSLDGPGQGETSRSVPMRHDYEVAATAVLDALQGRDDIDASRVGVAGVSLGGYYACRVAAFDARVAAAVSIGGPFNMGDCWPRLSGLTRAAFRRNARVVDDDEALREAKRFDLEGIAERVRAPLLVIFGKQDRLIPWEQAARLAHEAPDAMFVLHEEGNHVCNNMPYRYRPQAGDWLADRL